jgi:RecB family endonuclease NucS
MSATITIRDETTVGKTLNEFEIEIAEERITVRELIRSRVFQEVREYNARANSGQAPVFRGLIQPTDRELALNGKEPIKHRQIDWQRQFEKALTAVRANQILILVDDRQVESLDEEIAIGPQTQISFLRLTLLTGG